MEPNAYNPQGISLADFLVAVSNEKKIEYWDNQFRSWLKWNYNPCQLTISELKAIHNGEKFRIAKTYCPVNTVLHLIEAIINEENLERKSRNYKECWRKSTITKFSKIHEIIRCFREYHYRIVE